MASPLRLTVAAIDASGGGANAVTGVAAGAEASVEAAWAAVVATFERVDATMSRFRDDSELTRLNRHSPAPFRVSRDLARALAAADRATRLTAGRFDPRVVGALERIGYAGVPQGPGPAEASRPGMGPAGRIHDRAGRLGAVSVAAPIDLGGIGKGLALRWAARNVQRRLRNDTGVLGALIDAGGDIAALGSPAAGEPWMIAIEDPAGGTSPVAVVALRDGGAVATSSVRRLRWERDGRIVHHLIDPRTREPGGDGLIAVTVAGPDPAWAEVWSKALFLEGRAGIADLARRRGLAAWWVNDAGDLEMTPAARVRTVWIACEG